MSVSNCIFHAPHFPACMIEIYPRGEGYFYIYSVAMREEGGLYQCLYPSPLLFSSFLFFFLLITVHDRHAEREESNQGMVGEDISGQGREKNVFRGDVYGLYGVAVFFLQKRDLFIYRIWFFSIFENEIWLINILTFLP